MVSGVKVSKSRHSHSSRNRKIIKIIQVEMAESEVTQTVAIHVTIEAAMAVVIAVREVDAGPASGINAVSFGEVHGHRHGRPALRQPSFNLNVTDKYVKILSFEIEVTNILRKKTYKLTEEEKFPIIRNWLVRKGLQLIQTFTSSKKESCKRVEGLFFTLGDKCKLHHIEKILSLQCFKLKRKSKESAQEWMCRSQLKATDCKYKEYDRRLKLSEP